MFCLAPTARAVFILLLLVGFVGGTYAQSKDAKKTEKLVDKLVGKKSEKKAGAKKDPKPTQLRQINLSGNYVDLVQPVALDPTSLILGSAPTKQRSFYKLCEFLNDLRTNDRISYVLLDMSAGSLSMNSAQLDELTRRIDKLRSADKKIFAWLEDASNTHLAIAAACDEVIMAELGSIDMPSMALQSMFYSDAMDLVGVKASVVRAGDFKGAVEPYVNAKMSTHLRDHYLAMVETMNDAQVDRLSKGRGLKSSDIRELQGKRMLVPKDALNAGLVDRLAPFGSMETTIKGLIDEEFEWVTPKKASKKQVSMIQLMSQMMSGQSTSTRLRDNSIVVLHLQGTIIDGKKASAGSIVSGPTVYLIEKLIEEEKVKGVVVRVNSPGGSATASEAIRQALAKLCKKKPTVISMGEMAASGGYWVSCIDAPIYAEKGTLTGSIGVFSMKLSAGALLRRVGVHLESITLDDSAGVFALDRAWSDKDSEMMQQYIDMFYDRFLKLVSKSRGMKMKKLRKLAGGRVWSGAQAKRNGLVDDIGGLDDCLKIVSKKAKLDDYNVIHRPLAKSGLDLSDLIGSSGEEEIWHGVSKATMELLRRRGLSLRLTNQLLQDALSKPGKPTVWLLNPIELNVGWN